MSWCLLVLSSLLGCAFSQFVPTPPGFTRKDFTTPTGFFDSHSGYPTVRYSNGLRSRFVITAPVGQQVQVAIDPTNPNYFKIRPYDFIVMFEGSSASRVTNPCDTASYANLGTRSVEYLPVVMADISAVRSYTSRTNVAVLDFCVHSYFSGSPDPAMLGFRAFWTFLGSAPPTQRPPTAATLPPVGQQTCGRPAVSPALNPNVRIVNGVTAQQGSWPWACALVQGGRFQYCGCTIIDRQWVLTASHCVADNTESQIRASTTIYMGVNDLRQASRSRGNVFDISRVIKHPQYDQPAGTTNNDIALIKLATPITFSSTIQPACFPSGPINSGAVQTGNKGRRICYVGGWGTLRENQNSGFGQIGSGSDLLQQTSVEIFSQAECIAANGNFITNQMFCAGYDMGNFDSCQGDSGGPLVCQNTDGSWSISGVVSFGQGCARPGLPGVYANVYNLLQFIQQTMATN